jgi:hypothetical protein
MGDNLGALKNVEFFPGRNHSLGAFSGKRKLTSAKLRSSSEDQKSRTRLYPAFGHRSLSTSKCTAVISLGPCQGPRPPFSLGIHSSLPQVLEIHPVQ